MTDGFDPPSNQVLDGFHCCQSDPGKWSREGGPSASNTNAWNARLTAHKSDIQKEVTWVPLQPDFSTQAVGCMRISLFTAHCSGEATARSIRMNTSIQE